MEDLEHGVSSESPERSKSEDNSASRNHEAVMINAGKEEEEEEEDGFRTPTSLEHQIPKITVCPPAPSRKRPISSQAMNRSKRRAITFPVDSPEFESLFCLVCAEFSPDSRWKIKRERAKTEIVDRDDLDQILDLMYKVKVKS